MCWQNLLETLQHREQRLHAAGEIHRFHRDVAEALSRIQVKVFLFKFNIILVLLFPNT